MTGLETSDENLAIGRDPRDMSEAELAELGHTAQPILSVIRAKCMDCCNEQQSEVRKCVSTSCALWPYRMNKNPFRSRDLSDEQRAAAAERLARARASKAAPTTNA